MQSNLLNSFPLVVSLNKKFTSVKKTEGRHNEIITEISTEPSVLPPSMMTYSRFGYPWPSTHSMGSSRYTAWLNEGVTMEIVVGIHWDIMPYTATGQSLIRNLASGIRSTYSCRSSDLRHIWRCRASDSIGKEYLSNSILAAIKSLTDCFSQDSHRNIADAVIAGIPATPVAIITVQRHAYQRGKWRIGHEPAKMNRRR